MCEIIKQLLELSDNIEYLDAFKEARIEFSKLKNVERTSLKELFDREVARLIRLDLEVKQCVITIDSVDTDMNQIVEQTSEASTPCGSQSSQSSSLDDSNEKDFWWPQRGNKVLGQTTPMWSDYKLIASEYLQYMSNKHSFAIYIHNLSIDYFLK